MKHHRRAQKRNWRVIFLLNLDEFGHSFVLIATKIVALGSGFRSRIPRGISKPKSRSRLRPPPGVSPYFVMVEVWTSGEWAGRHVRKSRDDIKGDTQCKKSCET